jgi:hypothetical protein
MAMDSLASAAHAAGFAMVAEDDTVASGSHADKHKVDDRSLAGKVVFAEVAGRWEGRTDPIAEVVQRRAHNGIFDWMPSFSWRADGK